MVVFSAARDEKGYITVINSFLNILETRVLIVIASSDRFLHELNIPSGNAKTTSQ